MIQLLKFSLFLSCMFFFSSCFEISEEVNLNVDGSGKIIITANLSESKKELGNFMKMEKVENMRVPKRSELEKGMEEITSILKNAEGISNVNSSMDFENFIFAIEADFTDVENLNIAINKVALKNEKNPGKLKSISGLKNFDYEAGEFARIFKYPILGKTEFDKIGSIEQTIMETARYVSIYRFKKAIKKKTNPNARVSPGKKAIMFVAKLSEIATGKVSIENNISF